MAEELRDAGIRAEIYTGTSGMKAQLKYADKRRSPVAVIEGSDERAKGSSRSKDLISAPNTRRTSKTATNGPRAPTPK